MNVSLESYRVFYHVAQCGSFTKAAQLLYSNQPNVTRTIKNLEQALGCTLFIRTNRGISLTPEGEGFYTHIASAMEQIRQGEETLLHHSTLQTGTVRVGVSEIALHRLLLPVLKQFRETYPGVQLRILNSNSQQAATALMEQQVDFALLTLPIRQEEAFLRRDLAFFREVPVCAREAVPELEAPLTMEALSALPLISLCRNTSTRRHYEDWFSRHGLAFEPNIEAATADQILPMVRAGLGVGFIPELAAKEATSNGSVAVLPLTEAPPERTLSMVRRRDVPLCAAARVLAEMLTQYASPQREKTEA